MGGNIYLYAPTVIVGDAEYAYYVNAGHSDEINLKVIDIDDWSPAGGMIGQTLFDGTPQSFLDNLKLIEFARKNPPGPGAVWSK
jgi:hypothetical protein